jgi:hypothetical protein
MRLKQFLLLAEKADLDNPGVGNFALAPATDAEFAAWLQERCEPFLRHAADHLIYRGFKDAGVQLALKDTNEFSRRSANTGNLYTLWLDNHPAWREFPKRASAYICSNNSNSAWCYGQIYCVFPAATAMIGICPAGDIWDSFSLTYSAPISYLVEDLTTAFTALYGQAAADRAELDWGTLKQLLQSTTPAQFTEALRERKHFDRAKYYAKPNIASTLNNCPNLYAYVATVLDPVANKFKATTGAAYRLSNLQAAREVWVQGEVGLLAAGTFTPAAAPKTAEVLAKYDLLSHILP